MSFVPAGTDLGVKLLNLGLYSIYVLDEVWWWMKAIAKVVSPPPALFGMVQWNRYMDQGKTISTMGMINFWPEKKFEQFFIRQGFPPFSESRISIWTVLIVLGTVVILVVLGNLLVPPGWNVIGGVRILTGQMVVWDIFQLTARRLYPFFSDPNLIDKGTQQKT